MEHQSKSVHVLRAKGDRFLGEMAQLFAEVEKHATHNDYLSADLAFNRLEYILLSCQRADRAAHVKDEPVDDRVLAACHLISSNLQSSASVSEIAANVCLSPSRLSHLFRKHLGMGVVQWRECQRLQYAKQLLRVTNAPIKSLSHMVGYDDPLYFSRVFRRHVGMSPYSFRARSLGTSSEDEPVAPGFKETLSEDLD